MAGMRDGLKSFFVYALIFVVGIAIGLAIGGYGGTRLGASFILNETLYKDAKEVQTQVDVLRHLRAGAHDQAVEILEAHLDDNLIVFDPCEPYVGIKKNTADEIEKAISECRDYRMNNPRTSNRPPIDAMVANILKRETED
jgi:low affinity Fe/Cu permease